MLHMKMSAEINVCVNVTHDDEIREMRSERNVYVNVTYEYDIRDINVYVNVTQEDERGDKCLCKCYT
jgi:hypothetical protein